MRCDVAIVGAGIGGAVMALDLGTRGWRVALVERESAPPRIARPEVLWGATPRALERYGIADAIRDEASVRLELIEIGGATPWLQITQDDFAAAGVEAFSTNPSRTRAIIADAAVATGNVEIHRGVAVSELVRDRERVLGVRGAGGEEFQASLVVGDDGAHSIVRTQLGIPIELTPFPIEFVTAMIPRWPLESHRVRVWIGKRGALGLIPWPGNEGVLLTPVPANRDVDWSALERMTPLADALREQLEYPRDFKRVARPFGHVGSYVANGAALIGDAAHPMTPAGGQGANASIHDALALAGVADAALRAKDVSRERLMDYERMRRPLNEQSVRFSRLARRAFRFGRFLPIPPIVRSIDALGWPKRKIIASFATAFISRG